MKALTEKDVAELAGQLERTAKALRDHGKEAVRRARDWASPLRSGGTDPGRGVGGHGDPTASAAFSRPRNDEERERQRAAEEMTLLWVDANQCSSAAYALEHRVINITTDAVVENQRAGIGHCASCNRYCDGKKDNRLRPGVLSHEAVCDACRKREERQAVKGECVHASTIWSHGVLRCNNCSAVLDTASAG